MCARFFSRFTFQEKCIMGYGILMLFAAAWLYSQDAVGWYWTAISGVVFVSFPWIMPHFDFVRAEAALVAVHRREMLAIERAGMARLESTLDQMGLSPADKQARLAELRRDLCDR